MAFNWNISGKKITAVAVSDSPIPRKEAKLIAISANKPGMKRPRIGGPPRPIKVKEEMDPRANRHETMENGEICIYRESDLSSKTELAPPPQLLNPITVRKQNSRCPSHNQIAENGSNSIIINFETVTVM